MVRSLLLLLLTVLPCIAQTRFAGSACPPPIITVQPINVTNATNSTISFTLTAVNAISYQWQTNNGSGGYVNVSNTAGHFGGSQASKFWITNALASDSNYVRALVANWCGSSTSSVVLASITNGVIPGNGLLNSLTAVWEMEEGTGLTRVDSSGNSHPLYNVGTVNQDATHIQGSFAAALNTGSSRLTNADAAFQATTKFTGMFWFYPTSGQDGEFPFCRWGIGNVWTVFGTSGTFEFVAQNPGGGNSGAAVSGVSINSVLNKWHLCFFGFDSAANVDWISIDGENKVTAANANGVLKTSSEWLSVFDVVGGGTGDSIIKIDESAIWENRTLSQSDISTVVGTFNFTTQTGTPLFFSGWTN